MCVWWPALLEGGPAGNLFRQPEEEGVTIADVTIYRPENERREASLSFLALADLHEAERVFTDWAHRVGLRRLWFGDELIDLGDEPPPTGRAGVTCPNCSARWEDSTADFWLSVRGQGVFPTFCPLCGGDLPQWSLVKQRPRRGASEHGSDAERPRPAAKRRTGTRR